MPLDFAQGDAADGDGHRLRAGVAAHAARRWSDTPRGSAAAAIVSLNKPTTAAARNAVPRLTSSHQIRFLKLKCHGLVSRSSAPAPNIFCSLRWPLPGSRRRRRRRVIRPTSRLLSVDDRHRQVAVLAHQLGDFFLVHRRRARCVTSWIMMLRKLRLGLGEDQVAHRQHADQVPAAVDHVDVEHLLELFVEPAEQLDRAVDGEVFGRAR